MSYVYVQNKDGKPLMPTTRCGHVRFLLKTGQAVVVERIPFTVRLNRESEDKTQPLCAALDIGRTNIGVAVVDENGTAVFAANVETRNKDIPKLMKERKAHRMAHRRLKRRCKRQRRAKKSNTQVAEGEIKRVLPGTSEPIICKGIKNKPARFNNRERSADWLTPTANQLLLTHVNVVKKVMKFLPITEVAIEGNAFAFMQMDDEIVRGVQFSNGPLKGYDGVNDAVWDSQKGKCFLCNKPIEHYHHVVPKHLGGSDTVGNIVGLCSECHSAVHTDPNARARLKEKHEGKYKEYAALGILNQITPHLLKALEKLFPENVYVTDGKATFRTRELFTNVKDHYIDAYCVGFNAVDGNEFKLPDVVYHIKQYRRHDRQCCHQERFDRKYYLNKEKVATNRHRAYEQKNISLEEYVASGGKTEVLRVEEHHALYKDRHRVMPGSLMLADGKFRIFKRADGKHNGKIDRCIFEDGTIINSKKCIKLKERKGLTFIDETQKLHYI